jgi:NAD(P)-dependent dehydrogenase (short-subunit alcohol dehydrogenase family)
MSVYCTVVTGAASGIGYAVAAKLLSMGRKVAAVDLNAERLKERFGDNGDVVQIACDLTSTEGFKTLTSRIKASFDGVDGFVHAAGVDSMAPLGMISPEVMQRLFAIHAIFPVQFFGWMSKKMNHAPDSAAVLISSLSAHEGAKGHVAYAAAKGAVEGLLKPAAAELVDKGIRLNEVVLGVVETEMSQGWIKKLSQEQQDALRKDYPLGLGKPDEVADIICHLLSNSSRWIAGQTVVCDGGHMLV